MSFIAKRVLSNTEYQATKIPVGIFQNQKVVSMLVTDFPNLCGKSKHVDQGCTSDKFKQTLQELKG